MSFVIDYKDAVVVVTGTSSGIGLAIAESYAEAGANVVGCSRKQSDSPEAKHFLDVVQRHNVEALFVQTDTTSVESLKGLVDATIARFGKIDILVSSAGVNVFEGASDCTEERWQYNLDLNLSSHWRLSNLCRPYLQQSEFGVILLMTSNHAYSTLKGCFPYNVTKTAIDGLVRSLTIDWSPEVRVVGIAPGFVETEGSVKWFSQFDDPVKMKQQTIDLHPMKHIASASEIGSLCVYLSSPVAKFISGTTILIDGGRSAVMQDHV